MQLVLTRTYQADGTPGRMTGASRPFNSIEQPWRNNLPGHSCVPEGVYELQPYRSPQHGDTYCLRNEALGIMGAEPLTPEQEAAGLRNVCELHSANFPSQLKGCVAIGLDGTPMYDPSTGTVEAAVEDSRPAIAELMAELGIGNTGHTLTITSTGGPPT